MFGGIIMLKDNIAPRRKKPFKDKLLVILFLLFLAGVLYGGIIAASATEDIVEKLSGITGGFVCKRAEQSLLTTFLSSFGSNLLILAVMFALGFSAIAQPFELFAPVFYGLGVGITMGYIYKTQLFKGVVYCAVLVVPHTVIALTAIVLAAREAFLMSNLFLGCALPKLSGELSHETLKLYSVKGLVLSAVVLISAIVDCMLTFIFAGLFV